MTTSKVTKVLLKRGNTAQNNSYTGVYGELSIDMEANNLRIHDGVVPGGNVVSGSGGGGVISGTNYANANVQVYLTNFNGNIIPSANNVYSLGSITHQWKSLFVSNNTIYINGIPLSVTNTGNLTVNSKPIGATISYTDIGNAPTDISQLTDHGNLLIGTPGPQGNTGATGTSITNAQVVGSNLKVTFSNSSMVWAGTVVGPQGVGVASAHVQDGNLIITLSNSSVINTGNVVGPAGAQGTKGDTGAQGATGSTGATGPRGFDGPTGPRGPQGDQGIQGNVGDQGPRGFTGNTGPKGDQGEKGDTGNTGAQGTSVTLKGSVDIVANLPMTGNAGDGWIVQSDGNLRIWNGTTIHWDDIGKIVGPQGDQGPQGPRGFQGNIGPQGDQGPQGSTGPQGIQGIRGNIGPQGSAGPTGPEGPTGPQGNAGVGVSPGGTVNQVLTKNSSTDYDTSWQFVSKLVNGDNELVLGADGSLTLPAYGSITGSTDFGIDSSISGNNSGVYFNGDKTGSGTAILYSTNNAIIRADNNGTLRDWTFGSDGKLTFPSTTTFDGYDLVAAPDSYIELGSNNYNTWMGVDNNAAFIQTDFNTHNYTWTFSNTGKLTLPAGGGVISGEVSPPLTITLDNADWAPANASYTRDFTVVATPTWISNTTDSYVIYNATNYQWEVQNPAFGTNPIYLNGGSLTFPARDWTVGPTLGTVAPTGVYSYANEYNFESSTLTIPGTINSIAGNDLNFRAFNSTGGGVTLSLQNRNIDTGGRTTQLDVAPNDIVLTTDFSGAQKSWTFNKAGHLVPGSDNLQDIGTPLNRIRHLYVGPGSITIGASVLSESTSGKLVVPGLTRATGYHAGEIQDTVDQTHSFTTIPVIIDNSYYVTLDGLYTPNSSYVPAQYSVNQLDGEGFIDGITIDNPGSGWNQSEADWNKNYSMWAYVGTDSDPIGNFVSTDWVVIPFVVLSRAQDTEYEFSTGGGGSGVTVGLYDAENSLTNEVSGITTIGFDQTTGFNITEMDGNAIKVSLGSSWKTWLVDGQDPLIASGEDTVTFVAGTNMTINTDALAKTITFNSAGSGGSNLGTFSTLPTFLDFAPNTLLHAGQNTEGLFFSGNAGNGVPSFPVRTSFTIGDVYKTVVTLDMVVNYTSADFGVCVFLDGDEPNWRWTNDSTRIAGQYNGTTPHIYGLTDSSGSDSLPGEGTYKVVFTYDPNNTLVTLETYDVSNTLLSTVTYDVEVLPSGTDYRLGFGADQDNTNLKTYIKNLSINIFDNSNTQVDSYADTLMLGGANTGDYVFDVNVLHMANLDEAMYLEAEMTLGGKSKLSLEASDLSNTILQGVYDVSIITNDAGSHRTWTFDRNSRLTFPSGASISPDGGQSLLISASDSVALWSATPSVADGACDLTAVHSRAQNHHTEGVEIWARAKGNAESNIWSFDLNGQMVFPDGTIQTTAYTGGSGGESYRIVNSGYEVSLDPGGTTTFPGDLIVGDNSGHIYQDAGPAGSTSIRWVNADPVDSTMFRLYMDDRGVESNEQLEVGFNTTDGFYIKTTSNSSGIYGAPPDFVEDSNTWYFGKDGGFVFPDGTIQYTATTGNTVIVSDDVPSLENGQLWFNSSDGRGYIKYNDTVVDFSPAVIPQASTYTGSLEIEDNTITNTNLDDEAIMLTPGLETWRFTDDSVTFPDGSQQQTAFTTASILEIDGGEASTWLTA